LAKVTGHRDTRTQLRHCQAYAADSPSDCADKSMVTRLKAE
jgi:hypothetical protein